MQPNILNNQTVRIAGLIPESITDGPGLRLSVFTQGCPHHCPGCHNPETFDPAGGKDISLSEIYALFVENPLLAGITFSGGDPMMQPKPLTLLAKAIHALNKNVVCYTGYIYEHLLTMAKFRPEIQEFLDEIDILIDGPFILEEKDLTLQFRGSRNQRILYLNQAQKKSLCQSN